MTRAAQLALAVEPKRKRSAKADQCKCGCFVEEHAATKAGKRTKECLRCKPGQCKRFRSRARAIVLTPAWLLPPDGSEILWRPDTVNPKAMGWRIETDTSLVVVLDHLKTTSPNAERQHAAAFIPAWAMRRAERAAMGVRMLHDSQKERAFHSLVGTERTRNNPARIELQRVSNGELDGDNLAGALKFIRDGVAQALEVDDKTFGRSIPIEYTQARGGVPRFYAVVIRVWWRA